VTERRGINGGSLFTGIVMILMGVVFTLEQFDVVEFGEIMSLYWPMIIVFLGASKLFDRHTVWSGLWLVAIGAWMQVARLHLFGLSFGTSWPILMIIFGAGVIVRAIVEMKRPAEEKNHGGV
jgi:hypothetical protein